MLNNLRIQNYRLFQDFEIRGFAHVNLIVGKNNVGKSSLLEALHLLVSQGATQAAVDFIQARESIATRGGQNPVFELTQLFSGYQIQDNSAIHLEASGTIDLALDIIKRRDNLKFRYSNAEAILIPIKTQDNVVGSHEFRNQSKSLLRSNYITTRGFDYEFLAQLWDRIILTPKEADVIAMLQILEPNIERISFPSSRSSNSGIRVKLKEQIQPIPLTSMGDGMHRILTIAAILADSEEGYLLVDEIDTGLHYRTITDMWRLVMETAVRLNVQVFATTHSWDCVRSFAEALDMQDDKEIGALFRLERRDEGEIAAVRYGAEDLSFIISQNIQNLEVR
jgi:AAA15 family ATPase/GTPase